MMNANTTPSDNESQNSSSMSKLTRRLSSMIFDGFHDSVDDMDYSNSSADDGGYMNHDYSEGSVSIGWGSRGGGAGGVASTSKRTNSGGSTLDGYLSSNHFSSFKLGGDQRDSINRRFSGATLITTDLDDTTRREEDPSSRTTGNQRNNARVSSVWEGQEGNEYYDGDDDDDDDDSTSREGRALGNFVNARLSTFSNNIDSIGRARMSTFSNNIDTITQQARLSTTPVVNQRLETFTRNIDTIGLNTISALTTWQSNMETIAFGYASMVTGKTYGDEKEERRMHELMLCA